VLLFTLVEHIGQRELRNDSGEVMRRVEQGESFTITRHGRPIADLVPHARPEPGPRRTLGELHEVFRALPVLDRQRWEAERAEADDVLGDDAIDGTVDR
jgi:prevent-host-death family protein